MININAQIQVSLIIHYRAANQVSPERSSMERL